MKKILIEVYLPAAGKTYQIWVSAEAYVYQVTELLLELFQKMRMDAFLPNQNSVLCDRMSGEILPPGQMMVEAGVRNASRLMLI